MIKFYYSTQTCSTAAHIALEEAEIPFEGIEVSWKKNINLDRLALVNPLGQVPALVMENGKVLTQTIAILEAVAILAPHKNLMPAEPGWERSEALSWLAFIGADFQKSFTAIFRAMRWCSDPLAQREIRKAGEEAIEKQLAYIDRALAGKNFVLGPDFSVVDAYLFTIAGWCKWAEIKIAAHSNLVAHLKRIHSRPAVQRVLEKEEMKDFIPA